MDRAAVLVLVSIGFTWAVGFAEPTPADADRVQLEALAGQPVDIAPWAYAWRADRAVQEKPEAYLIPRRLERIDKVYRTASTALPPGAVEEHLL